MKFYVAPLEGITGYIFRNALFEHFPEGIDYFYAPFLMPHVKRPLNHKEVADILPSNNRNFRLVPQILTNSQEDFSMLEKHIHEEYGYNEININLGCPSKTVANKGKGSGFLAYPDRLDDFLYSVFENSVTDISIKTRIGFMETEEFDRLLEIYNKYPVKELIIHPRLKTEQYSGSPHMDVFEKAIKQSVNPLCFNGNVYTRDDYDKLLKLIEQNGEDGAKVNSVMLGRGVLRNPSVIRELNGKAAASDREIADFLTQLRENYSSVFSGETPVLFKMKEIWSFLCNRYGNEEKLCKKLLKSKSIKEYLVYEKQLLG